MVIRNKFFAVTAAILLVLLLGYIVERINFVLQARTATGEVINVTSRDSRCGGRRRSRGYACTMVTAVISFQTSKGELASLSVSSGSTRGSGQPISYSRLKLHQGVAVIYDPVKPSKAYEDTWFGVWGVPIVLFIFQLLTTVFSFTQPHGSPRPTGTVTVRSS